MATIRRAGFGTVFELEDSKVGIGTDAATHTLQALGNIRSEAATDIGISSLTTYQGFTDKEARFTTGQIDNQSQSGSTSGEIVIDGNVTVSSATTFTSGPQHLTVTDTFTLPSGDTNSRELKPTAGSLRFNQDFATLEFYTGNNWATVNTFTEIQNSPSNRGRGLFAGGRNSSSSDQTAIAFIEIASTGNAQSFGELATARMWAGGASNAIRGLFSSGTPTTNMDYVTIASAGDGITFGTCNQTGGAGSLASSTRALFGGGYSNTVNAIQFVEIMTLGNSIDFGDLRSRQNFQYIAAASNTTRGFFMGNSDASTNQSADVDFVTIASKGDSVKFTTLTQKRGQSASFSNSTRAVQACGNIGPNANTHTNTIDFISMSSGGNAIDFGDARDKAGQLKTGAASQTRGCFAGGTTDGSNALNNISFIQFSTTGDAQDFGELSMGGRRNGMGGLSDSHGGLGGF